MALAIPLTWWYEALRRFLLGRGSSALLSRLSGGQLLALLALVTVVFSLVSRWGYGVFERRARQRGTLDQTTLF